MAPTLRGDYDVKRHLAYALLASAVFASPVIVGAAAAPAPERIRGTITSVSGDTLHVKTNSGATRTVTLAADSRVATLSRASMADVKPGTFIGTATKGSGDYLTALEVVIFPESMRGTGEGHYAWDRIADTTGGGHSTASAMTNGNVSASVPASGTANSSMTNGNVSTATGEGNAQKLTVTYKGGQQTIIVPLSAPIVLLHPADRSALASGDKVFAVVMKDGSALDAKLVAVGTGGVTPPM